MSLRTVNIELRRENYRLHQAVRHLKREAYTMRACSNCADEKCRHSTNTHKSDECLANDRQHWEHEL